MKLREIVKNLEILQTNADMDMEISGVSYDSRETKPGDLFVAVRGYDTDGHKYIPAAVKAGAALWALDPTVFQKADASTQPRDLILMMPVSS